MMRPSSVVADQSLLVRRLAIELRQSTQKGDVVVTGPRYCLVLNCSVCVNGQQHDEGDSTAPKPSQE